METVWPALTSICAVWVRGKPLAKKKKKKTKNKKKERRGLRENAF
jgi:hypothetical protein